MTTKAKTIHSVEEFRGLYYPDPDPQLDYFDGTGPGSGGDDGASDEPERPVDLDEFARELARLKS